MRPASVGEARGHLQRRGAGGGQVDLGVIDGTRTRDNQFHKLGLYQLSYDHHVRPGRPGRNGHSLPDGRRTSTAEILGDVGGHRSPRSNRTRPFHADSVVG